VFSHTSDTLNGFTNLLREFAGCGVHFCDVASDMAHQK